MPAEVLIMFFGGLAGIGGIILAGQWIQAKHAGGDDDGGDTKRLVDSLRDEVRLLRDDVSELDERLRLTERQLSPGGREGANSENAARHRS
jgi:hypothetical protein